MDGKSARNLRLIGLLVVAICILMIWMPMMPSYKIQYDDAIASTLAIGIGLLLIAEIGPFIRSFKAGGVEIEFLNDKFNTLQASIAELEMRAKQAERAASDPAAAAPGNKPAPKEAKQRPNREKTHRDDPQKGRWGGKAENGGFKLSATFPNVTRSYVEIVLRIETEPGRPDLADAECVEFHLHDTFRPDIVPAVFHDGVAELSLLAYGGFTVGAWIACAGVELELDLAKLRGAPRLVREN